MAGVSPAHAGEPRTHIDSRISSLAACARAARTGVTDPVLRGCVHAFIEPFAPNLVRSAIAQAEAADDP